MKRNKGFTTPCYMVVKDGNHANRLIIAFKNIGDRKVYGIPENVTYPCVCGVSTNIISFGELNDLAGFINCEENEDLFLALASLRNDSDIHQWFVADSPLSVSYDDIVGNDHYFTESKGSVFFWDINWMHATIISGYYHKVTVEELIEHFKGKEK